MRLLRRFENSRTHSKPSDKAEVLPGCDNAAPAQILEATGARISAPDDRAFEIEVKQSSRG
jgi:hypothetical protein